MSDFMKAASQEARSNLATGEGGPFGAVIVRNGKIIARAHNQVLLQQDPTAHAEIQAIRAAARVLGTHDLSGCELYTSCYPCPMCLSAIIWANIRTVHYGNTAADAGAIGFRDDKIYHFITGGCRDAAILQMSQEDHDETISVFADYAAAKKEIY